MVDDILKKYKNNPDLKTHIINNEYTIIYFESITSKDKINDFITSSILLSNDISSPILININKNEISKYLHNGYVLIIKNNYKLYVSEVRKDLSRSIESPETEPSLNGPKDAFTENIETNLGLIKRRIKLDNLKIINMELGTYTKTSIEVLYIDNLVDKNALDKILKKLDNCNLSNIIDSSIITNYLEENNKIEFPTIKPSERPDEVSNSLIEGKIIILVDNSPFQLIMPSYFTDFINPVVDRYQKSRPSNFIKFIRYLCLVITLVEPAYYIATINYNQETIPTSLLINFMIQREGVPFPSVAESIIMLIIYEILRESDLRFPSKYGTAISILGALILGEAAVNAGIVSPIMIITIALCFISSLMFSNQNFNNALRIYRFLFLISASVLGLYGIMLVFLYLLIKLASTETLNKSYTTPLAPFNKKYFFKYIWRTKK